MYLVPPYLLCVGVCVWGGILGPKHGLAPIFLLGRPKYIACKVCGVWKTVFPLSLVSLLSVFFVDGYIHNAWDARGLDPYNHCVHSLGVYSSPYGYLPRGSGR